MAVTWSSIIISQLRAKITNIHEKFRVDQSCRETIRDLPTRRSDYVRVSTCAFSLWKEHCNVGTDAEFQRVKLNENVNESIASDMKNSNPIITEGPESNGAGIFISRIHCHNTFKEIRASEYHSFHPRSITVKSQRSAFAEELVKKIIRALLAH